MNQILVLTFLQTHEFFAVNCAHEDAHNNDINHTDYTIDKFTHIFGRQ